MIHGKFVKLVQDTIDLYQDYIDMQKTRDVDLDTAAAPTKYMSKAITGTEILKCRSKS